MITLILLVLFILNPTDSFKAVKLHSLKHHYATRSISRKETTTFNLYNLQFQRSNTFLSATDETRKLELTGEDAARFDLSEQKISAWAQFSVAVSGVMASLYYLWLADFGPHLGDQYLKWMESLASGNSTLVITYMLGFFALCHSGLASIRPKGEEIIGARPWRYVFAMVSLPLAFSAIVYFINHR